jgi:hypothetical protein
VRTSVPNDAAEGLVVRDDADDVLDDAVRVFAD